ncbi:hypothetical protein HET73_03315, partial [Wolbachia endosymbiont of Atemnus politus]|uniref:hypothetical protein n=1 Tax=Wolbachia endosymbiont of Atemnus politus TaxID=2682840 RepID=UPI001574E150
PNVVPTVTNSGEGNSTPTSPVGNGAPTSTNDVIPEPAAQILSSDPSIPEGLKGVKPGEDANSDSAYSSYNNYPASTPPSTPVRKTCSSSEF